MRRVWVYDPHSGGTTIPKFEHDKIRERIISHANKNYSGKFNEIDVIFRGKFCYIDAYIEPYVADNYDPKIIGESREEHIERLRNTPTHLCRLRYFGDIDRWSMAFFSYASERYEPSVFNTGDFEGTLEDAFDTSSVYLID